MTKQNIQGYSENTCRL